MSVHALLLPELDDLIRRGSPQRQAKTLERVTTFFLDGASSFNKDHLQLFDLVLTRLIDCMERKARTELSFRLAPLGNAPVEAVRRLARDDSIAPRLFHKLLLTATDRVQRPLLASVALDRQAEIRHTPAREFNETSVHAAPADYSRAQRRITALQHAGKLDEALLVGMAESVDYEHTIAALASLCVVPIEVVDRLMRAERPEPVLILCRSAGWGWATAEAIIKRR